MSLERVIKALVSLGISRINAEIFVHIANKGPQKSSIIANSLKISNSTTCASLKKLEINGLVIKDGLTYSAVPFEEALEILIRQHREQEKLLVDSKKYL